MKIGAIAIIITTIVLPALAWASVTLFNHESRISVNETINKRIINMENQIKEIHKAVHGY